MKMPNPLNLHDILGNASEMTADVYRLNYYYGRPGGFVVKGGSLRTGESDIRSSLREDCPFYNKEKLEASKDPNMGFRPVIGDVIITSIQRKNQIKEEWKKMIIPAEPTLSMSFDQAKKKLDELHDQVAEAGVKRELSAIKGSYDGIARQIREIEQMDADSFFRIGSHVAHTVKLQLQKKALLEDFLADLRKEAAPEAEMIDKTNANLAQIEKAINENLNSYGYAIENLNKKFTNSPDLVKSSYDKVMEKLRLEGALDQIKTTACVFGHVQRFLQRNAEAWKADLANAK